MIGAKAWRGCAICGQPVTDIYAYRWNQGTSPSIIAVYFYLCNTHANRNTSDVLAATKVGTYPYQYEMREVPYISFSYGLCSICNRTGIVTGNINCEHGYGSAHWYCGHNNYTSANYHT